jgi:hypothetical protein
METMDREFRQRVTSDQAPPKILGSLTRCVAAVLLLLPFTGLLVAQKAATGALTGMVTDQTGAVVQYQSHCKEVPSATLT